MNAITGVYVFFTPVSFLDDFKSAAFIYVDHETPADSYTFYRTADTDDGEVELETVVTQNYFTTIPKEASTASFRVVATKSGEDDVAFTSSIFSTHGKEDFVTITGQVSYANGDPICELPIKIGMFPSWEDTIAGANLIVPDLNNEVFTDENSNWQAKLPANLGADESKTIAISDTYFSFSIGSKVYIREINLDDGLAQNFEDLLLPEKMRYKRKAFKQYQSL